MNLYDNDNLNIDSILSKAKIIFVTIPYTSI